MKRIQTLALIAASTLWCGQALAGATPEEIKQLGTTLTPVGAEKAGNKDGTIPAWDGGLCTPPANYKPVMGAAGGAPYADPYANDKPIVRVTNANLAQHAERFDEATRELFRRYPAYAIDIYPTRRSACLPKWIYENTEKRINNPKLQAGGVGISGAHAQIPFPIPKSGYEVMWNGLLRYELPHSRLTIDAGLANTAGVITRSSTQTVDNQNLYWDNTLQSVPEDKPYWVLTAKTTYPTAQAGVIQMRHQFLRADQKGSMAWSYIPGQRRVRLAPEFNYDTVATTSGGILIYDEINGFDGKMDKFDFKLVGKKEMYIPYNNYKFQNASLEATMGKNFANPDLFRWELHRVWVVEATLKPGERHVQKKKVFYFDEDSWLISIYYSLDQAGKPHHLMQLSSMQEYEKPAPRGGNYVLYDLNRGIYGNQSKQSGPRPEDTGNYKVPPRSPNYFTPDSMAGSGVR
ncbi:MAG: DUF1329 domain-containing protein [Pseudomonadota bacterium]